MSTTTYQPFMDEGDQYLKAARGGRNRPAIFTPEILYNMLAIAIEKHIMAALISKGFLADNHTFSDLIDATRQIGEIDGEIADKLREYESYQEICAVFEGYTRKPISTELIEEMVVTAGAVQQWTQKTIAA